MKKTENHPAIARLYETGKYTTAHLAQLYGVTPRQIQRIATKFGVVRTAAESNKVIAPLKRYRKIPKEMRVTRKSLSRKVRYKTVTEHPYCSTCGMRPDDGVRLEVDHIDNDPSNNVQSNLQVLCALCNMGKSHLDRFGV
jgi:hypothetical protein